MVIQELEARGDELKLITHANTDEEERLNWERAQHDDGFIRDERGRPQGRVLASVPAAEAARLEAMYDLDWLAFSRNGDKAALRRLFARFPEWRCSSGRF